MSNNPDLILLHPPCVYDFRKRNDLIFPYIFNTCVKVSPMLEMFPLGFYHIKSYLEARDIKVEIYNLASMMIKDYKFDFKQLLIRLKPRLFGVDLHWLVHSQGALEVCRIIKEVHKEIPVVLGGITASYFYKELINYSIIDFIIRGNIAFQPLELLIKHLNRNDEDFSKIPNLCYKKNDKVIINTERIYAEKQFFPINWKMKELKQKNINFISCIATLGCRQVCSFCGASKYATKKYALQSNPLLYQKQSSIIRELDSLKFLNKETRNKRRTELSISGYWHEDFKLRTAILKKIKELNLFSNLHIELFRLMPRQVVEDITNYVDVVFEISPESHDFQIRKFCSRGIYKNSEFESWLEEMQGLNVKRIEVFFMIGLTGQTKKSVIDTINYCEHLLMKFGNKKIIIPFISAMVPFLNPASLAFEKPKKYGYRLFYRTVKEHAEALTSISLKNRLNYETKWMSREEILDVTYEATKKLILTKIRYGYLPSKLGKVVISRLDETFRLKKSLDKIDLVKNSNERIELLRKIAKRVRKYNGDVVKGKFCEQDPANLSLYNFWYEI